MTTTYDDVLRSLGLTPSGVAPAPRSGARCGTRGGYARHHRLGEDPCAQCRAANAEYKRNRVAAPKDPAVLPPINHGTPGGARQHYYRREQPCEACRDAYNATRRPRERRRSSQRRDAARGQRAAA